MSANLQKSTKEINLSFTTTPFVTKNNVFKFAV
jgi:hypothetical protein